MVELEIKKSEYKNYEYQFIYHLKFQNPTKLKDTYIVVNCKSIHLSLESEHQNFGTYQRRGEDNHF